MRLGIAVTTYSRRDMVVSLCAAIRLLTQAPFDLVVCDDGSTDGAVEALKSLGETVIGATNGGIARNKNRGIWYLLNRTRADVILLLDDDVAPTCKGWEADWIEGALRFGHLNWRNDAACTPSAPGAFERIGGCALAFSRNAIASIGFMDPRFVRYGHEHSDLSFRAVRAGFGGRIEDGRTLFYVIGSGLKLLASESHEDLESRRANLQLLGQSSHEQIYRHAWRDDAERTAFLAETEPL